MEKEAFAVGWSVSKVQKCILDCDHKPLEPFLSYGMKIPKINHGSMELSNNNLMFIHIKGSRNILADAIFQT